MEKTSVHHTTSVKVYLLVFGVLALLTGLTVLLSYAGLPHSTAVALAVLIATVKVTLISLFFMHLRFESKGIYAFIIGALFFLAVLILSIIPDIGLVK